MEPIENSIADLLRMEVFSKSLGVGNMSSLQILKDMTKWAGLLTRPNVMKNLIKERDSVLDGLL